jgi:hypothetical protein
VRRALRAAKSVNDLKNLAPILLDELSEALGDADVAGPSEPRPEPKPKEPSEKPKPKEPSEKPKPKEPSEKPKPSEDPRDHLLRFDFKFSDDHVYDATLRTRLVSAHAAHYSSNPTFRLVFDMLVHTISSGRKLTTSAAGGLAERCLRAAG